LSDEQQDTQFTGIMHTHTCPQRELREGAAQLAFPTDAFEQNEIQAEQNNVWRSNFHIE